MGREKGTSQAQERRGEARAHPNVLFCSHSLLSKGKTVFFAPLTLLLLLALGREKNPTASSSFPRSGGVFVGACVGDKRVGRNLAELISVWERLSVFLPII